MLLCSLGSRAQKLPKTAQKNGSWNRELFIFLIGTPYIGWYHVIVNPDVQRIQNMYGKGGR